MSDLRIKRIDGGERVVVHTSKECDEHGLTKLWGRPRPSSRPPPPIADTNVTLPRPARLPR